MTIDMPAEILSFIDGFIDAFITWDLLIFFARKGEEPVTLAQVSQILGRSDKDVAVPLKKLTELKLLTVQKRVDGEVTFRLNSQSPVLPAFKSFAAFNDQQENRLKILSYLLQKKVR
ncbi:MAG TPA: hypothetical protein VMU88_09835 [bacterium]|nr:hypothetical protein [bacterium]